MQSNQSFIKPWNYLLYNSDWIYFAMKPTESPNYWQLKLTSEQCGVIKSFNFNWGHSGVVKFLISCMGSAMALVKPSRLIRQSLLDFTILYLYVHKSGP